MPATAGTDILVFGGFRFERRRRVLARRNEGGAFAPLAIGSRALAILGVLVERPGELVTRAEIMAAVWPGTAVEDGNLNVQIAALRRVLDEGRTDASVIQTFPGRGYRFAAPVTWVAADPTTRPPSGEPPLPHKPSLAVMPFQNMSDDPGQEYFADGIVEEIITALSRITWLFVIARNSTFTYRGQVVDVTRVGRELGVRYVLEGAVRKGGGRVRIGAQPAFDLYLRALHHHVRQFDRNGLIEGLALLEQAIDRDPDYGPALALAAQCHRGLEVNGWAEDPETTRRASTDLARRALRNSPDDPQVLGLAAFVLGYWAEDIDVSLRLIDRCLALNPSHAHGWYWGGLLRVFAGQPELALDHFEKYLRLSPRERLSTYLNGIGEAYFFSRHFKEAAANLLASLDLAPTFPVTYRVLASCYAHMGRLKDAREIVRRLRAITPAVMESATRYRKPELRELFLSGLRMAVAS